MNKHFLLGAIFLGGSLHAMQTPSGQYFAGWGVISTSIDTDDMVEAISHGIFLARKLDEAQNQLCQLRAERDEARADLRRYQRLLLKVDAKLEKQKGELPMVKKRKKRGLRSIKEMPEKLS